MLNIISYEANANQNNKILLHTCKDSYNKKTKQELMRIQTNWNSHSLLVGLVGAAALEKQCGRSSNG